MKQKTKKEEDRKERERVNERTTNATFAARKSQTSAKYYRQIAQTIVEHTNYHYLFFK